MIGFHRQVLLSAADRTSRSRGSARHESGQIATTPIAANHVEYRASGDGWDNLD
jgi:hypothetical protein